MNNITLFYGKRHTNPEFSNFHIAPFVIDGVEYPSSEHYFMFEKARLFDPGGEALKKMSVELSPAQMKKLGRLVNNFDGAVWDEAGRVAMYRAVYAKFTQNPELKEKLLATENTIIAEASPFDRKWGIGMGVSNENAYNPDKWRGRNWLGQVLMEVRDAIRAMENNK